MNAAAVAQAIAALTKGNQEYVPFYRYSRRNGAPQLRLQDLVSRSKYVRHQSRRERVRRLNRGW